MDFRSKFLTETDKERISLAVQLHTPIEIYSYTLPREKETYIQEVLNYFLIQCHQEHMVDNLGFCLGELLTNSKKANTSVSIITLIIKWWKQLLVVAVSAMVVSLLVSFLIKPKYKSTVVMMPTASNAVSQMLLEDGNYNEFLDPSQFGDDMKVDHMLQILNSRQIKDHLIATFDLINYYELDTNKKYWLEVI